VPQSPPAAPAPPAAAVAVPGPPPIAPAPVTQEPAPDVPDRPDAPAPEPRGTAAPAPAAAAPDARADAGAGGQPRQDAPAPQQAAPAPAATAPATPAREVPLPRVVPALGHLLQIAQQQGVSRARLTLRPAELGGIEIRLTTDATGLTATVLAESPQAAQVLQEASGDLRRSLERSGVTVAELQIGMRDGTGAGERQDGGDRRGSHGHPAGGTAPDGDGPAPLRTLTLPDGVLVDVLA
jgi:hypothetical protein